MPLATEQELLHGELDPGSGAFVIDEFEQSSPEVDLVMNPPLADPEPASDIEVEVLPEPEKPVATKAQPGKPDPEPEPEVGSPQYTAKVKARIDEQNRKTNTERRAREFAERQRDEAIAYGAELRTRLEQAERAAVNNHNGMVFSAKAKLEADLAAAEGEYEKLLSGDTINPKALTAANRKIAELTVKKSTLDNYRDLQYSGPSVPEFTPATAQRQEEESKPIAEAVLWKNRNPLFESDADFRQAALQLDIDLKKAGDIDPRSPEFFTALDRGLRDRFPAKFQNGDGGDTNGNQPSARQSPPAQQRRSGGVVTTARTAPNQPSKITLTASEAASADRMCPAGMDRQKFRAEYARNKRALENSNSFEVE